MMNHLVYANTVIYKPMAAYSVLWPLGSIGQASLAQLL